MNRELQQKCLTNYERLLSNNQITNDFIKKKHYGLQVNKDLLYNELRRLMYKVRYLLYLATSSF